MKKTIWNIQSSAILTSFLLLTLAGILGSVLHAIGDLTGKISFINMLLNGRFDSPAPLNQWNLIALGMLVLEMIGYLLYFAALKQFAALQQPADACAVMKIRTGAILTLTGTLAGAIPFMGWIVKLILILIGFIKMLQGYKDLKNSFTFPPEAAKGASTLYSALIVSLVGAIIGLLPLIGSLIESILDIVAFFMIISGWNQIKYAVPAEMKGVDVITLLPFRQIPGGRLLIWALGIYWGYCFLFNSVLLYPKYIMNVFISTNSSLLFLTYCFSTVTFFAYWWALGTLGRYLKKEIFQEFCFIRWGIIVFLLYLTGNLMLNQLSYSLSYTTGSIILIATRMLLLISLILQGIGYFRLKKAGHPGYMGKRGAILLTGSVCITAASSLLGLFLHYLPGILSQVNFSFSLLSILLNLCCWVFMWQGWKYLLSSWFGTNDPEPVRQPAYTTGLPDTYRHTAGIKTDDELKAILQEKTLYNEWLVKAAEKELLARMVSDKKQELPDIPAPGSAENGEPADEIPADAGATILPPRPRNTEVCFIAGTLAAVLFLFFCFFLLWNNTAMRLTERGNNAYRSGHTEQAIRLLERAAVKETDGYAAFRLYQLYEQEKNQSSSNYYLRQAADQGHWDACSVYGEQKMEKGLYNDAIPYLQKAFYYNERAAYLLGCAYFTQGDSKQAKEKLEQAAKKGCREAYIRLGDWYLCYGNEHDFAKALECYEKAPESWPGIEEKTAVLKDLKRHASGWSTHSWDKHFSLYSEDPNGWEGKTVRRGIYKNAESKTRYYGKFNATATLLSGPGIIVFGDGCIYAGQIQVNNVKGGWDAHLSGQGAYTQKDGSVRTARWKNDVCIESTAVEKKITD